MLTAENLLQGIELVMARAADAVVWSDDTTEDRPWTVCHLVKSQLLTQTRAILRHSNPSDRNSEAKAVSPAVALVHKSSGPGQLATALHELFQEPRLGDRPRIER